MQITLNQEEIDQAVQDFVRSQINIADNQEVSIDFTAGRGPNGLSAAINIATIAASKATVVPVRTKPKAVETTPKSAPVEENETTPEAEPEAESQEAEAVNEAPETPDEQPEEDTPPRASIFSAKKSS